jgi:hypothetical protein
MSLLCTLHVAIYLLMLFKDALYYIAIKASVVYDDMIMNFELLRIKGEYVVCCPKIPMP